LRRLPPMGAAVDRLDIAHDREQVVRSQCGLLLIAGLFQFSRIKHACLRACRSPLGFLLSDWRPGFGVPGGWDAPRFYCLGCCWALMALLFVARHESSLDCRSHWPCFVRKTCPERRIGRAALGGVMIGAVSRNGLGLHCHETVASRVNKSLLACEDALWRWSDGALRARLFNDNLPDRRRCSQTVVSAQISSISRRSH